MTTREGKRPMPLHVSARSVSGLGAAVLCALAAGLSSACAEPRTTAAATATATATEGGTMQASASPVRLTNKPATVNVNKPAGGAEGRPLLLRIKGLKAGAGQSAIVRVFVGMPKADASTPTTDSHFAGLVTVLPASADRAGDPMNANIELAAAMVKDAVVAITLVPVGADGQPLAAVDLSIDSLALAPAN